MLRNLAPATPLIPHHKSFAKHMVRSEPMRLDASTDVRDADAAAGPQSSPGDTSQSYSSATAASTQLAVQNALRFALTDLTPDGIVLSFSPVAADLLQAYPQRILAPPPGKDSLDLMQAKSVAGEASFIVGACMLTDEEEELEAVRRILLQVLAFSSAPVFMILLVPGNRLLPESTKLIMNRHDELLKMGASDVIVNPGFHEGVLKAEVNLRQNMHYKMSGRMEGLLETVPPLISQERMNDLEKHVRYLMWEGIPQTVMPLFPRMQKTIREHGDSMGVGSYRFLKKCSCSFGRVMRAVNADNEVVAVKCISKAEVNDPFEIDLIYREWRFLAELLTHPNITKCTDLLHTEHNIYMVLEYAGDRNLEKFCEVQPQSRVDEDMALQCLRQLASGLAWMHRQNTVHRHVSLTHVVVNERGYRPPHFTLVDFRFALVAKPGVLSTTKMGDLPCIAPEIVLRPSYVPRHVDSWSVGVLLLEIAGGLTSLQTSVGYENEAQPFDIMQAINEFFSTPSCHVQALAKLSGVRYPTIVNYLQELVLPTPASRMSLPSLSESCD